MCPPDLKLDVEPLPQIVERSPLDAHHLEHRHQSQIIGRVSETVRKNPLPSLAGAAAVAAALTYIICSRNRDAWWHDGGHHAEDDSFPQSLQRALASIKFW